MEEKSTPQMSVVKKEDSEVSNPKELEEKVVIENKYVFICFPPDGEEAENKRLLGKLEELFPAYEFVFGNPLIWKGEAEYLLNGRKAVEINNVLQEEGNKATALETAKLFETYIRNFEKKYKLPGNSKQHFFYWELKKIINENSQKKITNKETKDLIDYLKLYGFVQEYDAGGKKRYCLVVSAEDEKNFLETKMLHLQDKISFLEKEKNELEKQILKPTKEEAKK